MNRYLLTAKSLISNSRLVQATFLVFAIVSCYMLFCGAPIAFFIFFFAALTGFGYTSRVYLKSERRRLVPGMNETCASTAVTAMLASWFICSIMIGSIHGFHAEYIGGCFAGLAFALWLGCFEKAALFILIFPYALPLLALSNEELSKDIYNWYTALPPLAHAMTGLLFAVAGVGVLARYWFIITSKNSPLVRETVVATEQQKNSTVNRAIVPIIVLAFVGLILNLLRPILYQRTVGQWAQSMLETAADTAIAFLAIGLLYALWRGLIQYFSPTKANLTMVGHFLFGYGNANRWSTLPLFVGIVFVVSFLATNLIEGSESDESIHAKIGFSLMFPPFIVGCVLLHGIPRLFSRLWITGASNNRGDTGLTLLLSFASRILPASLLAIAFSLTVAMSTTVGVLPTFMVSVGSLSIGAAMTWILIRIYPWIAHHVGLFVFLYLAVLAVSLVSVVTGANDLMIGISETMNRVGVVPCVLGSVIATTVIWILCIWDAARSLGNSAAVMEVPGNSFAQIVE